MCGGLQAADAGFSPHHKGPAACINHMSSETGTLASIIQFLRCPRCGYSPLEQIAPGVACPACSTRFPLRGGILDTMGDARQEVITPFQRVMQTPIDRKSVV